MSAPPVVEKVSLCVEDGALIATPQHPAGQACSYLDKVLRNEKVIHNSGYSDKKSYRYSTKNIPGYYHVICFVKDADGNEAFKRSNPVFFNPVPLGPEALPQAGSGDLVHLYKGKQWDIPTLYYPNPEQKWLYVVLAAAVVREKTLLPVFNRWTWAQKQFFPGETLCIADPTLTLDPQMTIGWYLGTGERELLPDIAEFVTRFAKDRGIPPERIVTWGSSAGGFAAMALSARLGAGYAVAINPQIDIPAYRHRVHVQRVSTACFGGLSDEVLLRDHGARVAMSKVWNPDTPANLVLVQNIEDPHHYTDHFMPFWAKMGGSVPLSGEWAQSGHHHARVFADPKGHVGETQELASEIIERIRLCEGS